MLVRQSKYDALLARLIEAEAWRIKHSQLQRKWNNLVDRINAKGGEDFLQSSPPFTPEDLQKLIQLCHPDKHGGKPLATEMTQKLLNLKGKT